MGTTTDTAAERRASARAALERLVPRISALVRSMGRPGAPAVGTWSAVETAVHLSHVYDLDRGTITGETTIEEGTLERLGDVTTELVAEDPERDPAALAERFETYGAQFLATLDGCEGDPLVSWLGGARIPVSAVTWHCVEETLVHGRDIAVSQGAPWAIERAYAAPIFPEFVVPFLRSAGPGVFVNHDAAKGFTGTFDVRVRGGGAVHFVFEDGDLTLEDPAPRRVDVHLSADPVAFLLVQLERLSPLRAALTGKITAWGRRPWLAAKFGSLLQGP